jgi:hypothetical protein
MKDRLTAEKYKSNVVVLRKSTTSWRSMGSEGIDPRFLYLGTIWMWMVSFSPSAALTAEKEPRVSNGYEIGWTSEPSGWCWEVKIIYPTRTRTPTPLVVHPVVSRYTDCATVDLARKCNFYSYVAQCIPNLFSSRTPWLGFSFMSTPSLHYPRPITQKVFFYFLRLAK